MVCISAGLTTDLQIADILALSKLKLLIVSRRKAFLTTFLVHSVSLIEFSYLFPPQVLCWQRETGTIYVRVRVYFLALYPNNCVIQDACFKTDARPFFLLLEHTWGIRYAPVSDSDSLSAVRLT